MIGNPYNFSNPVREKALFSGRAKGLKDLTYYIEQAATAPHPINIALLGPRASGKTSYLNMIQLEAEDKGFCVVRLDLNETDVATTGAFFTKLIEELFLAAVARTKPSGELCFGGQDGRTYQTFIDLVSEINVQPDPLFMPLSVPIIAAKQRLASGTVSLLPETLIKKDLEVLRKELERPVAIAIDECDLLTKNGAVLQMVRNVFMASSGFLLVFAGTPSLFPLMDEVFSPVVRQFKKFDVGPFEDVDDTRECILAPLKSISNDAVDKYLGHEEDQIVGEIHEITGGRPYEIQLMCFFMFKNVQLHGAHRMQLNIGIIEEVRHELDIRHDLVTRPLIERINALDHDDLRALKVLLGVDTGATIEEAWNIDRIVQQAVEMPLEQLRTEKQHLESLGLFEAGEKLVFKGDDVDRLYLKYRALAHDVRIPSGAFPPRIALYFKLLQHFLRKNLLAITRRIFDDVRGMDETRAVHRALALVLDGEGLCDQDQRADLIKEAWVAGWTLNGKATKLEFLNFKIEGDNVTQEVVFYSPRVAELSSMPELLTDLDAMTGRAREIGVMVSADFVSHSVPSRDELLARRDRLSPEARREIAEWHQSRMNPLYVSGDSSQALAHALAAYKVDPTLVGTNIAYVFLASGKLELATKVLDSALEMDSGNPLAWYDLAMLNLANDDRVSAKQNLRRCAHALEAGDMDCIRMLVPEINGDKLRLSELKESTSVKACLGNALIALDALPS